MKKLHLAKHTEKTGNVYDLKLMFSVLLLVGIGIVMVYSASSAVALKKYGSDYFFLKKQVLFSIVGFLVLIFCRHFPFKLYKIAVYPLLILALAALLMTYIPGIGYSAGGAVRWFKIGNFTFQPSVFARFAMIIYLAYSLTKKEDRITHFTVGFLPHVIVLSIFVSLIALQPDFGAAVLLTVVTGAMLFIGGVKIFHLSAALLAILPFAYIFMINAQYRVKRLVSFLDPWQYSAEEGYQTIHSLMAFGTGGFWGTGLGKGHQKLFYLPEPHTDFIFSVVGEELGFVGCIFIIALYGIIIWRGISIAKNTGDSFGSLLSAGITITIGLQLCVNMGVALGLLPTKGLTLPYLSYGGTSLLFCMASAGILMNIHATENKR